MKKPQLIGILVAIPLLFSLAIKSRGDALDTWTLQTSRTTNHLFGIAYGNNAFVAVGTNGVILKSSDGETWAKQTSITTNDLNTVAYGGGRFVAAGSLGTVITSTNGSTWTKQNSGFANSFHNLAYLNGLFFAVGYAGAIMTSADGVTWTSHDSGTTSSLHTINYAMGKFIAAGYQGAMVTSLDGNTWSVNNSGVTSTLYASTYGSGTYLAMGFKSTMIASPDGTIWSGRALSSTNSLRSAIYLNGTFVVAGFRGTILTSRDGLVWTNRSSGSVKALRSVAYGNNAIVVVGHNGTILKSGSIVTVKGNYNGLLYDTNTVQHQSSGYFTATVTGRGAYSGSLMIAGSRFSFRGQFNSQGQATNTLLRAGLSSLTVELQLDMSGTDQITGRVSDGVWIAELLSNRSVFNAIANPCPFRGQYTLIIPGNTNGAMSPGGHGFGTVSVDRAGLISLQGVLADGTKIVQRKVALSKNGYWPFYLSLYGGKGSVVNWLTFTNRPMDNLNGDGIWIKTSQAVTPLYPKGFTNAPAFHGSIYRVPLGTRILDFTNGAVIFSGGNLTQSWTNTVMLGANNKVVNTSSNTLTLAITLTTGLFKGSFVEPGTGRKVSFTGAVQQKQNAGFGYFLGTSQSGAVRFEEPSL